MPSSTLQIQTRDGTSEAYVSRPDRGRHPGVLFYPAAIGLRPRIEEMADRVAGWGYVVLAPHIFYRDGSAEQLRPMADLRVAANREAFFVGARSRLAALTVEQSRADLDAYLEALLGLPDVLPGDVGVTGYCLGGRLALRAAAARPDVVAAAGAFHAGGLVTDDDDSVHRQLGRARAEVYAGHADHDPSNPAEAIAALGEALEAAGLRYTSVVFPGAVHGYTMSDTSSYDEEATERHFRALEALLDRTLTR